MAVHTRSLVAGASKVAWAVTRRARKASLLTVELREVSGNSTVEGGHGIVVTRGRCDVRVGDAGGGAGVNCDIKVQSNGSVDQERFGGRRVGQEGRAFAIVGEIVLRSGCVDVPGRHRCLADHESVIGFRLLVTANVRIFIQGTIINRVVVIVVPSRLPRRKSQRAEGGMWTEGRLVAEGGGYLVLVTLWSPDSSTREHRDKEVTT